MTTIRTAYDGHVDAGGVNTGRDCKVDQSFREECDINRIMKRYDKSGTVPQVEGGAQYLDVSQVGDFLHAQLVVKQAEAAFAALPANQRERFHHQPAELVAFLQDPANDEEARELGLLNPLPVPPPKAAPMEVIVVDGATFKPEA